MNWSNYEVEGQLSLFDPGSWFGKTSPELSAATAAKTSEPCSKRSSASKIKTPLFLDLRTENGRPAAAYWATVTPWHGEYTTRSFGEYPSDERESRLSQILVGGAHPKYFLSARACQGILRRAENRGKTLPEILERTLRKQSVFKSEPVVRGGAKESLSRESGQEPCQPLTNKPCSNKISCFGISPFHSKDMESDNLNAGIYKADTSRTLDLNGGTPACNQGGMAIVEEKAIPYQDKTGTLNPGAHGGSYNGQDAYNDLLIVDNGGGKSPTPQAKPRFF